MIERRQDINTVAAGPAERVGSCFHTKEHAKCLKTHASLDQHIGTFMARLAAENHQPGTMNTYRFLLNRLVSLIVAAAISPAAITMEQSADQVRSDERRRREPNKCQNIARRFIAHLIDSGVAAAPIATPEQIARELLRVDYDNYLARQRGLSFPIFSDGWSRPVHAVPRPTHERPLTPESVTQLVSALLSRHLFK